MLFGNPNIGNSETTEYTVKSLSGGKKYYFKVRAGNGCMPGDFSNEIMVNLKGEDILDTQGGTGEGFTKNVLGVAETKTEEVKPNDSDGGDGNQWPWWKILYWAGSGAGLLALSYFVLRKKEI